MKPAAKKLICALLTLALVFCCACAPGENEEPTETAPEEISSAENAPAAVADSLFTLNCVKKDGFDPFSCGSLENTAICQLIYESLYITDNSFKAEPLLCESAETEDGILWSFTLKSGVKAHDGAYLTAGDAVYSLLRAKSTRWSARFKDVTSAESTGNLSFTVRLSRANMHFPALLDTPIVKKPAEDSAGLPAGTGPYIYDAEANLLRAFPGYRAYASLPFGTVYLTELAGAEITKKFQLGDVDLVYEDALAENASTIYSGHEKRRINTAVFQYVGFNTQSAAFSDARVRRAMTLAIDREYITETVMQGAASEAETVFSPELYFYSAAWEDRSEYSYRTVSAALASMGFADFDSDGLLEMPAEGEGFSEFAVKFIVNDENEYKVAAAREIAYEIRSSGVDITLSVLPWDEYKKALSNGAFDMYYAETRLTPDFDLTSILSEKGALNYGKFSDTRVENALAAYMTAEDEKSLASEAEMLSWLTDRLAPIAPVLYRSYYVRTGRGTVTGLSPSASSIFGNIADWTAAFNEG